MANDTTPPLPYIPQNLLEQIFHKLPYNDLTRSKLVCKSWNSIITFPKFINDYFRHLGNECNHIDIILLDYKDATTFNFYSVSQNNLVDDVSSSSSITSVEDPKNWGITRPRLYGSYNGLVAISCGDKLILWNPLTKEYSIVDIYIEDCAFWTRILIGLCYDASRDEYSVVVGQNYQSPPVSPSKFDTADCYSTKSVYLYDFKDGSTKHICNKFALETLLLDYDHDGIGKVVFGVPHWVVTHCDYVDMFVKTDIFYFDLSEEKFKQMARPDGGWEKKMIGLASMNGEKQLGCVLNDTVKSCLEVWVMNEYGQEESWSNMFTFSYLNVDENFGIISKMDVMGILPNGEVLIYFNNKEFRAYDIAKGKFRNIKLHGIEFDFITTYESKVTLPPPSTAKILNEMDQLIL